MRVALVSGFWGQNIGNAFYNLGGHIALSEADCDVSFIQDQPAYWTFRNEYKGNFTNAWPLLERLDVDLVVLQGPLFTRNFGRIWLKTLTALKQRRVAWAVLSAGFRSYSPTELAVAREVFEWSPPLFASTRDAATADGLRTFFPEARQGVDSAFFLPKAHLPPALDTEPYVTFCFDHFLEPELRRADDGALRLGTTSFTASFPKRLNRLSARSKAHAYLAHLLDRRSRPERLADGATIVRPEHRVNPHIPAKIYRHTNGIASDEPWTYLSLYANTDGTLSDRVHACVATLAYGNPAHLHNPTTKRHQLFEAFELGDITERTVQLPPERVDEAFDDTVGYLRKMTW